MAWEKEHVIKEHVIKGVKTSPVTARRPESVSLDIPKP